MYLANFYCILEKYFIYFSWFIIERLSFILKFIKSITQHPIILSLIYVVYTIITVQYLINYYLYFNVNIIYHLDFSDILLTPFYHFETSLLLYSLLLFYIIFGVYQILYAVKNFHETSLSVGELFEFIKIYYRYRIAFNNSYLRQKKRISKLKKLKIRALKNLSKIDKLIKRVEKLQEGKNVDKSVFHQQIAELNMEKSSIFQLKDDIQDSLSEEDNISKDREKDSLDMLHRIYTDFKEGDLKRYKLYKIMILIQYAILIAIGGLLYPSKYAKKDAKKDLEKINSSLVIYNNYQDTLNTLILGESNQYLIIYNKNDSSSSVIPNKEINKIIYK